MFNMMNWKKYAKEVYNYDMITTFGNDFDIAEIFGPDGIQDTYKRAFNEWKGNYKYLTELVLILNWKIWQHWEAGDETTARIYNDLWDKTARYAAENLTGAELDYYYRTTD